MESSATVPTLKPRDTQQAEIKGMWKGGVKTLNAQLKHLSVSGQQFRNPMASRAHLPHSVPLATTLLTTSHHFRTTVVTTLPVLKLSPLTTSIHITISFDNSTAPANLILAERTLSFAHTSHRRTDCSISSWFCNVSAPLPFLYTK